MLFYWFSMVRYSISGSVGVWGRYGVGKRGSQMTSEKVLGSSEGDGQKGEKYELKFLNKI